LPGGGARHIALRKIQAKLRLVDGAPAMPPFDACALHFAGKDFAGATMSSKRRSYEAGHKRKYLVVIDDTEECDRALFWAAKRAERTKSQLILLRVIETAERNQQWLGVADIMKAEAMEAADAVLDKFAARVKKIMHAAPDKVIREGSTSEEIVKLIDEDADIGILVLAAATGKEGPGPLISNLAKTAGTFPIPVAIVPGNLSDEDLEAMA
jgi:nucleotide-binding universal stress UspA family protein